MNGNVVLWLILGFIAVLVYVVNKCQGYSLLRPRRSCPLNEPIPGGVRAGVIVGRKVGQGHFTGWVRGEPLWQPPIYGTDSGGYSFYQPGRYVRDRMPSHGPPTLWLCLRSDDGRSSWVEVDEATYGFPDGHYVDLRS